MCLFSDKEATMEPVGALTASLIFGALILKLVDFLKYLRNADWNGVVTLLLGWVAGVVAIQMIRLTDWDKEIKIGALSVDQLDFQSQLVLGFVATSVAAVIYDFKKAVDNTDTASTPRLGPDAEKERQDRLQKALPTQ
jgi:hypothetical protein